MKSKYQNHKELTVTFENDEIADLFVLLCRAEADRRTYNFSTLPTYSALRSIVEEALDAD